MDDRYAWLRGRPGKHVIISYVDKDRVFSAAKHWIGIKETN